MIGIEELGLSKTEIQDRVIDGICRRLLSEGYCDEDAEVAPGLEKLLEEKIVAAIDVAVTKLADEHVLPSIGRTIESFILQKTTEWGEKKGKSVSFAEYLVQRADAYMTEHVDRSGQPQGTQESYNWHGKQTRVAHMIDEHLHHDIEQAMEEAMDNVNTSIARGLHETVRIKLNEVAAKLKVTVSTGR